MTKRLLIVGMVAAALLVSGLSAAYLSGTAERGPALGAECVYADSGDYASKVIPDEDLAGVVRMLVNYYNKSGNKNLYALIASDEYKALFEKHGTRITEYTEPVDPEDPDSKSLVELYDKPVSQTLVEAYNGAVDLSQYPEISDLTGLNSAIRVTSVTLPSSMTAIPGKTFESMMKLNLVVMPSTVTAIGDGAFEKCESLKSLLVYDPETYNIIAPVDESQSPIINVIYLKGITSIGNSAFKACKGIEKVYFGEDDEEYMKTANVQIGSGAFTSCTSLKNVTVPKGTLGTGVFSSCRDLTSIVFDDSYTKIPDNTLSGIASWVKITLPADLEEIGAYAMSDSLIESINIESCTELTTLDEHAFSNSNFATMLQCDLSNCSKLKTIGREAFAGARFSYTNIDFTMPDSVTEMGCGVFYMARRIKSVNISSALTEIPDMTFFSCYDLKNVQGGENIEKIGAHAFEFCSRLDDASIWNRFEKLKSIGDYAFAHCIPAAADADDQGKFAYGMDSFTFRDSVTEVGKSVFEDNFMMLSITTGEGMTEIPERFHICEASTSPTWIDITCTDPLSGEQLTYPVKSSTDSSYKEFRDRFNYKQNISLMSLLVFIHTSKSKIQSIGDYAFFGNTSLTGSNSYTNTLELPPDLTTLGKYAFAGCARTEGKDAELKYYGIKFVRIPDSISSIGEYAFANDFALQTARFPEGLEAIPAHCFDGCGHNNRYKEEGAEEATDHFYGLWCIADPRQLKSIGDYAFNNCYRLKEYRTNWDASGGVGYFSELEFGRNLEYLGRNAFTNTAIRSASSLIYTKIESLGTSVFEGCRMLSTVYCPDTLTSIGDYAFRNCQNLDTMTFPVYASLSATMIAKNERLITMTPTLGRYLGTNFRVPVSRTISLPANAFARRTTDKISQVYVDGPDAGKDVEIDKADPQYFTVTSEKNQYRITGGDNEVLGTAVRISASVPFTDSSSKVMNIDYPLDVVNTHADPEALAFDPSKIKIGSQAAGTVVEKDGETYLYVNSNKIGSMLTIALDAKSTDEEFPGIITDDALWSSADDSVLALKEDSITKTTSADKTTTTAQFEIKGAGEAVVSGGFDDTEGGEDPETKIHVCIVDPIRSVDFTLTSIGEDHRNMTTLSMPEGQQDKMNAVPAYTNEDDKRDFLVYTSADPTVITIDDQGNIKTLKPGKVKLTVASATGSTRREITVTSVAAGEYVDPLFIDITGPIGADNKGVVYCGEESCFKAKCLPEYAAQSVKWTVSSEDASLEERKGDAYVTGVNPNKTLTLTAQAKDGETLKSARATLQLATSMKASTIEFREEPPTILIEEVKNFRLSSDAAQAGGIVRTPESSYEAVTFTSGDPEKLLLGTSRTNCTETAITLSGQSGTLYYKGIKDGETKITAETASGIKAELKVTVKRRPQDVTDAHAVAATMAFDASAFRIGNSGGLTPVEEDGKLVLYVNKSRVGTTLTLALDGQSDDKDYPNIITDDPSWSSSNESILALKEDGVKKTVGTEKTLTTAVFDIKTAGEAEVSGGFVDEAAGKSAYKTIKVVVLDPIKSFDMSLESAGEGHKNMTAVEMPLEQKDQIKTDVVYVDEEDKRDKILFTSADSEIASVDENGNITAKNPGKVKITIASATGSSRREITVTVAEKDAYVAPLYIDIKGPVEENRGVAYCDAASTFKAVCLPDYAAQSVKWTISSEDAKLEVKDGEAYVTGVNPNKTLTLTAQAIDGEMLKPAKTNLQVGTLRRAETVVFKEIPPFIKANEVSSLVLSSNEAQTNGAVRTPADSWDKVTFTSSDPTVLTLGTNQNNCTRGQVTLAGQSPRLYYMGFRNGTATITARTSTGSQSVLVVSIVTAPVTGITCTEPSVTLLKGKTAKMKIQVAPEVSTDPITYSSSDPTIADIGTTGKILAKKPGTAYITARSRIYNRTAQCTVRVLGKGEEVTVGTVTYTVYKDNTLIFTRMYNVGTKVTVPDTVKISGNKYKVTRIAKSALRYNATVTRVVIGANITWIGTDAFNDNPNLKTLEVKTKKLKTLGKRVVKNCKPGMTIKLKKAKFKAYKKKFRKSGVPAKTKFKKF